MDKAIGFIPLSENLIFLHNSNLHLRTAQLFRRFKGMIQELTAYSSFSELRENTQMIQLTSPTVFKLQRIEPDQLSTLEAAEHRSVFNQN